MPTVVLGTLAVMAVVFAVVPIPVLSVSGVSAAWVLIGAAMVVSAATVSAAAVCAAADCAAGSTVAIAQRRTSVAVCRAVAMARGRLLVTIAGFGIPVAVTGTETRFAGVATAEATEIKTPPDLATTAGRKSAERRRPLATASTEVGT